MHAEGDGQEVTFAVSRSRRRLARMNSDALPVNIGGVSRQGTGKAD